MLQLNINYSMEINKFGDLGIWLYHTQYIRRQTSYDIKEKWIYWR